MLHLKEAVIAVAAASSLVFAGAAGANADSGAFGAASNSPGILSGNVVNIPVDIAVDVCGNNLNGIGLFNAAMANYCENIGNWHQDDEPEWHRPDHGADHGHRRGSDGRHHEKSWEYGCPEECPAPEDEYGCPEECPAPEDEYGCPEECPAPENVYEHLEYV
ncbi:chaplin [Streptomyces sp. NPDC057686]|uniref:chaplin n=1 Tax=Streptomyces sp. NPDC057686 TaxID=3346212 RepID=UPI0036BF19CB